MTSIRGHIEATRRPGELGVHSMDSFNLIVPDLAVAHRFYSAFGLEVREEGNNLGLYTAGNALRWASISAGRQKRLNYLSFGVFEDDFDRFKQHIEKQGQTLIDPPSASQPARSRSFGNPVKTLGGNPLDTGGSPEARAISRRAWA